MCSRSSSLTSARHIQEENTIRCAEVPLTGVVKHSASCGTTSTGPREQVQLETTCSASCLIAQEQASLSQDGSVVVNGTSFASSAWLSHVPIRSCSEAVDQTQTLK